MEVDHDSVAHQPTIVDLLNDDCLLEIFRYLDLNSLIIADQVCQKFAAIAQILYKRFSHYEIHIRTEGNLSGEILRRIGRHLNSLLFSCGYLIVPTTIIRNIVTYCTNLRRLKLQYVTLGDVDLTILEDLFARLTHLDISCARVSHIHTGLPFILNAPKLQRLRLHFFENKCEDSFLSLVTQNPDIVIEKYPQNLVT